MFGALQLSPHDLCEQRSLPFQLVSLRSRLSFPLALYSFTDDRALYSFGYNEYGQLGLGNTTNTLSPELVTSLASMAVKKVVAGFKHTAIIAGTLRHQYSQ